MFTKGIHFPLLGINFFILNYLEIKIYKFWKQCENRPQGVTIDILILLSNDRYGWFCHHSRHSNSKLSWTTSISKCAMFRWEMFLHAVQLYFFVPIRSVLCSGDDILFKNVVTPIWLDIIYIFIYICSTLHDCISPVCIGPLVLSPPPISHLDRCFTVPILRVYVCL